MRQDISNGARAVADRRKGNLACSIVSSSALGKVAEHYGFGFRETLTGFKWISKVPDLIFGYEEALGYCVDPEHVRDKDGVSALLLLCELAAATKADPTLDPAELAAYTTTASVLLNLDRVVTRD